MLTFSEHIKVFLLCNLSNMLLVFLAWKVMELNNSGSPFWYQIIFKVKAVQTSPTQQHLNRSVAVSPRLCFSYKFTYYPAYFKVIPTASLWQFGAQAQDVLFKFCIVCSGKPWDAQAGWVAGGGSLLFQSEGKEGGTHENKRGLFQLWRI